jgi:hypothetical protein
VVCASIILRSRCQGARFLDDLQRNARFADVMEQRRLHHRRQRGVVETDLAGDHQAEERHVDGVAVGQVLVLFDGEDLSERGVAPGHARQQHLHQIPDRHRIELLAVGDVLEGLLGPHQRLGVGRIERSGRRIGPLLRPPLGVERHQTSEADRADAS